MATPARVVNRGIAAAVLAIIAVVTVVAIFGDHANAPADSGVDTTNTNVPTTLAGLTGARPANTQGSWFSSDGAAEQYDYPMKQLSCASLERYLTADLCAVAYTTRGAMMFVATEGYWDPSEPDDDGVVRIPLYFQVFTHTTTGGPARAASVLDGELYAEYEINESEADTVVLSTARVLGDDVYVVRFQTLYGQTPVEQVQMVAMNPNGAPTMVATYRGDNVRVSSTDSMLFIAADRYGPPNNGNCCENYATVWSIAPRPNDGAWFAVEKSVREATDITGTATPVVTVDSYDFPQKYGITTPT